MDGGLVGALSALQAGEISSYGSIKEIISFGPEPLIVGETLAAHAPSGYDTPLMSFSDIVERFLQGSGIPDADLADECGLAELAANLKEDLGDVGARARLFHLAATSSCQRAAGATIGVRRTPVFCQLQAD